uniref:Isoleucine N-monooxygenase 2-like n=2 Tax=Nicotiana tabacum TaxID=4097 RepID=A0A1S3ZXZ0_TOBAC|nr:PREDICTED: isoleucine N-monooxygenase 2-like [Nicotiana tabacum]
MEEMETEIACIRLGSTHVIAVTSPELACHFLKEQDSLFSSRRICMSATLISNGYLTSVFLPMGDQWMKMRRFLASHVLLQSSHLWLRHKRDEEADHLLRFVYNQYCSSNEPVTINLRKVTRYYCANVVKNMIFSKRLLGKRIMKKNEGPSVEEEAEEQVEAVFTLLDYLYSLSISEYLPWLSGFDLDGHKAIIKKAYAKATKLIDHEIDQRLQIWKDSNKAHVKEDILDVLIRLKDTNGNPLMSVKEIKAQVLELMLATVDNPSNAVECAIKEMLNKPQIMQRALEEIDTVVGRNRLVQESDLPQLNYVKACLREAFRLHPLMPFNVPHVSVSDTIVGEYFIHKGSVVLLSRLGLGRNPRVWEDPMKFKPEHHLKEEGGEVVLNDSELHLFSFSIGRRGCPGVKLGSTITTMLLARLLQGFNWNLPPNSPGNDFIEKSGRNLSCTVPFFAQAKPRLSEGMYS